jgi:hypothetical protein
VDIDGLGHGAKLGNSVGIGYFGKKCGGEACETGGDVITLRISEVNRSFRIERLDDLSGPRAVFYAVKFFDTPQNELEGFVQEFGEAFENEIDEILTKIDLMACTFGAREHFFKEWEGAPGDGVCALYDQRASNLRLYCIRFGKVAVILGNGGPKSKRIRALQEDTRLTRENRIVREVSRLVHGRLRSREITWRGNELGGDLEFLMDGEDEQD